MDDLKRLSVLGRVFVINGHETSKFRNPNTSSIPNTSIPPPSPFSLKKDSNRYKRKNPIELFLTM